MEKKGLRGSSPARIDDKGRLKVPTMFRGVIQDQQGPDVFVTSLTGECVRIYPTTVWAEIERKALNTSGNHPALLKFLDRVNYYGQAGELDDQGRIVIPTPWSGRYVLEVTYFEAKPGGSENDKFDRTRHITSLSFVQRDGQAWSAKP